MACTKNEQLLVHARTNIVRVLAATVRRASIPSVRTP
ncbi:hypothetical protein PXNS11_310120 [Stutzerimonas xanthomarina]|nr:hypothetical protein PXNS11_310120 [Stutzerimonas xanthomarina]